MRKRAIDSLDNNKGKYHVKPTRKRTMESERHALDNWTRACCNLYRGNIRIHFRLWLWNLHPKPWRIFL